MTAGDASRDGAPGAAAADPGVPLTRKERRHQREAGAKVKRRSKHPWLDRFLILGMVIVVLGLVAEGFSYFYVDYRFSQVKKVKVKHLRVVPVGQPFNVLLIGSDSRAGLTPAQQIAYGSEASTGGQRSDVVKIVHIVPATGQASVLSIPRDTMVTVAGDTSQTGTYNRINATYGSGPDQLVQTIEANFGIPIEHVVQIDFDGLEGAVQAIGGINLDFPYPAKDTYTGLNITQTGCQLLNGGYALALARSRHYQYYEDGYWHYDGTSDFGRIQRQNAFLKAMINQAKTRYNPLTLNAFIGSVVQGLTIDSTFTVSDLVTLAQEFHTFSSDSLATSTLPTYSQSSSTFADLGDVLYVDQPLAEQVITQFLGGPPDQASTPPPDPYGAPEPTTTTTAPVPTSGGSTPATSAESSTTTSIETDFDPTPC
jgi:LCP family protein required for cell wall assembly